MRKVRSPLPVHWNAGLCLLESVHARQFRMPWTSEAFHKIIAPLHGKGRLEVELGGGASHCLAPGGIALVGSGNRHRIRDAAGSPLHLYILCLAESLPLIPSGKAAGVRVTRKPAVVQPVLLVLRQFAALPHNSPRAAEERAVHDLRRFALAAELFARLLASPKNARTADEPRDSRGRLAEFLRRLDTGFYLHRSLEDAARETGMSRRRFTQLFSELTGRTYGEHVRKLRIRHAGRLLREQGRSPIAAAFECGYEDLSTFYRAFKKETGMSPSQWAAGPTGKR